MQRESIWSGTDDQSCCYLLTETDCHRINQTYAAHGGTNHLSVLSSYVIIASLIVKLPVFNRADLPLVPFFYLPSGSHCGRVNPEFRLTGCCWHVTAYSGQPQSDKAPRRKSQTHFSFFPHIFKASPKGACHSFTSTLHVINVNVTDKMFSGEFTQLWYGWKRSLIRRGRYVKVQTGTREWNWTPNHWFR